MVSQKAFCRVVVVYIYVYTEYIVEKYLEVRENSTKQQNMIWYTRIWATYTRSFSSNQAVWLILAELLAIMTAGLLLHFIESRKIQFIKASWFMIASNSWIRFKYGLPLLFGLSFIHRNHNSFECFRTRIIPGTKIVLH